MEQNVMIERVRLTEALILHDIRRHMQRAHITRSRLVRYTGISGRTMDKILTGQTALKVNVLMNILEALDVDAVAFLARVRMEEQRRIRLQREAEKGVNNDGVQNESE